MELKQGYKQTEVGVIPKEWDVLALQEVCRVPITYGIVQCGPHIPNGVPYIRVSDMDHRELDVSGMMRTSPSIASMFSRSMVLENEIVYALRGALGEVREVSKAVAGANLTQGTARLAPKHDLASGYLLWAMRSTTTIQQAELGSKGTTFREITLADLRQIRVLVPPLSEQQAIAAALSDVDALIASLDRLIAKKRDMKQAAMQELLTGKRRLAGFNEEWEMKTVGQIGEVITGGTPATESKDFWGGDIPWVTPTDISSIRDMNTSERQLTAAGLRAIRQLPPNSVLVTCIASIGKNAILRCLGACNQQINAVVPTSGHNPEFVYYLFEFSKQYLLANAGATATAILSKSDFSKLQFRLPHREEQTAIATILSDIDVEITALEQKRDKTRQLKQGMMQELLTGRIRLV